MGRAPLVARCCWTLVACGLGAGTAWGLATATRRDLGVGGIPPHWLFWLQMVLGVLALAGLATATRAVWTRRDDGWLAATGALGSLILWAFWALVRVGEYSS